MSTNGKILLLSEIFPPKTGGSGRWFWEVYSRWPRERLLVVSSEDSQAEAFDRTHDLPIIRMPLTMRTRGIRSISNARYYWRTASALKKIVRSQGISVVHSARNLHEGFTAWLLKKMTGTPYLMYSHGEDISVSRTSRELAWMTRRILSNVTAVIANSQNTKTLLLNDWKMPDSKVHVVHPGMDAQRFVPADRDESVRAKFGWQNRLVILTVGRLQRRKGHDMLIRALPAIRDKFPQALYAIIGHGEEEARLKQITQETGQSEHVQFLGGIDDTAMVQCYQQCDLFALPNRTIQGDIEGFGMVLLEAQACGKPVLAGASGGTAETMQVPETGRIVPCESPEPIAQTIIELFQSPETMIAMGRRGRDWAVKFDWPVLAKQAHSLFEQYNSRS